MTLTQAFNFSIYYVAPFWAIMIFLPKWNITKKIMGSFIPFIPLCCLYIYYLLTTADPSSLGSAFIPKLGEYAKLFGQDGGALVVTIHFLAMDLFLGRWIYWQGQEKNIWVAHSLIFSLFFAPAGLLSHLITAYFSDNDRDDNESETDAAV
ncbi:MAG: ABA4-like family protein [Cyanobacteria bacterium J06623_7]